MTLRNTSHSKMFSVVFRRLGLIMVWMVLILLGLTACGRKPPAPTSTQAPLPTATRSPAQPLTSPLWGLSPLSPPRPLATPTPFPWPTSGLTENSPEVQDYAQKMHVSPQEALRRLQWQDVIDVMDLRLRQAYGDRMAGIYIEHTPTYQVVVQFKGRVPPDARRYVPPELQQVVVFRPQAFSEKELEDARTRAMRWLQGVGLEVEASYVDIRANVAVISVASRSLKGTGLHSKEDIMAYLAQKDPSLAGKVMVVLDQIKIKKLED